MLKSSVKAEIRNDVGSNASNRIRNQGHVPGVLYGQDLEPKTIEVNKKEISNILRNHGTSVLLDVEINNQKMISMIKEIQRDPVNNEIIHIDFQKVSFDKPISATVPIVLVDREKVESKEATLQNQMRELHIECLPQNIPESIEISVKDIAFGHPLKIGDVEFSDDISVLHDSEEVIASLTHIDMGAGEEAEEVTEGEKLNKLNNNIEDNITTLQEDE